MGVLVSSLQSNRIVQTPGIQDTTRDLPFHLPHVDPSSQNKIRFLDRTDLQFATLHNTDQQHPQPHLGPEPTTSSICCPMKTWATQTGSGSLKPTTGVNPPRRLYPAGGGRGSFHPVRLRPNNCDIIGSTTETHTASRLVNISILVKPDVNVLHKRRDFNGRIVDLLINLLIIINDISGEIGVARVTCLGRKLTARAVCETPRRVCLYVSWARRVAAIDHIKHDP